MKLGQATDESLGSKPAQPSYARRRHAGYFESAAPRSGGESGNVPGWMSKDSRVAAPSMLIVTNLNISKDLRHAVRRVYSDRRKDLVGDRKLPRRQHSEHSRWFERSMSILWVIPIGS